MSALVTTSRVPWHSMQATNGRLVIQREGGTLIVADASHRAQERTDTAVLLPLHDVLHIAATYPWPSLQFVWVDRTSGTITERTELLRPDQAADDALFAETIRKFVERARESGIRSGNAGWLTMPPPGGKTIGEIGLASLDDGRAHVVRRVLRTWRAALARHGHGSVPPGTELLSFPAVNISFNTDTLVLGSVAPGSFETSTTGMIFNVDDIAHVRLVEPWPQAQIESNQNDYEQTLRLAPQEGEELVFEAAMERIAAIVSLRAKSRIERGWLDRAHAYVDLVEHMPDLDARAAPGGAFRTSAEAHADPVQAHWKRDEPTLFERAFGGELGPYELTLTRDFLYAALEPNVFVRYARNDFHTIVHDSSQRYLVFGRGTPLRIPNGFDASTLVAAP